MSYIEIEYPAEKPAFYDLLNKQLLEYCGGEPDKTAVLANASAVIKAAFSGANWAGFYLADGEALKLCPFQGRPAVSRIPKGKGVCGAAWQRGESVVVEDVGCFEGHIVCDCSSRSEIVIPIFKSDGGFFGVLDMDSTETAYFSDEDRAGLEDAAKTVAGLLEI